MNSGIIWLPPIEFQGTHFQLPWRQLDAIRLINAAVQPNLERQGFPLDCLLAESPTFAIWLVHDASNNDATGTVVNESELLKWARNELPAIARRCELDSASVPSIRSPGHDDHRAAQLNRPPVLDAADSPPTSELVVDYLVSVGVGKIGSIPHFVRGLFDRFPEKEFQNLLGRGLR